MSNPLKRTCFDPVPPLCEGGIRRTRRVLSLAGAALPRRILAWAIVLFVTISTSTAIGASDDEDVPLEMRPYRVSISVAVAPDALPNPASRARFRKELAKACRRRFGAAWTDANGDEASATPVTVTENRSLLPPNARGIARLTLSDVAPLETEAREPNATNGDESRTGQETDESTGEIAPAHKVFLLALDREGIRFHLAGREADLQLRDIGPVVETRNVTRQRIVPEATELLARLFRPLAEIEAIEGKDAALRLQAADLRPGTINVRKASLLRPVLRFRDPRTGEIRKHQSIRWTYLRVTQRKRYRCRAQVLSGIRSPLGQKRMRLVDRFALLARPAFEQTECTLYPQGESETRLVGYRVLALPPRPIDEDEDSEPPDPLQLLTDYRGRVVIERNPDVPLYWLSVRSGKSRLATVPFVPGLHETLDIPLPNDRVRLAVDGQLALLEGDLVSVIAERALLTSLARKAARRGDNEQADEYVREIANLPTLRSMTNRLNLIRVEGKQRAGGDRIAVALIDRECDRLLGVLRRYLNQSRMEDLRNELDELKEVYNSDRRERRAVEREG